jgi:hypothetical protein
VAGRFFYPRAKMLAAEKVVHANAAREGARRERALADWRQTQPTIKAPDEATVRKTHDLLAKTDPEGACKNEVVYPSTSRAPAYAATRPARSPSAHSAGRTLQSKDRAADSPSQR